MLDCESDDCFMESSGEAQYAGCESIATTSSAVNADHNAQTSSESSITDFEINPSTIEEGYERSKESSTPVCTCPPKKRVRLYSDQERNSSPEYPPLLSLPSVTHCRKHLVSSSDSDYKELFTIPNPFRERNVTDHPELICAAAPGSPEGTSSEMDVDSSPRIASQSPQTRAMVFRRIPEAVALLDDLSIRICRSLENISKVLWKNQSTSKDESEQIPLSTAAQHQAASREPFPDIAEQPTVHNCIDECMNAAYLVFQVNAPTSDAFCKEIYQLLCEFIEIRGLLWDITKMTHEECKSFKRSSFKRLREPKKYLDRISAKCITLRERFSDLESRSSSDSDGVSQLYYMERLLDIHNHVMLVEEQESFVEALKIVFNVVKEEKRDCLKRSIRFTQRRRSPN